MSLPLSWRSDSAGNDDEEDPSAASTTTTADGCSCATTAIIGLISVIVITSIVVVSIQLGSRSGDSHNGGDKDNSIPKGLRSLNWCGRRRVASLTFDDGPSPERGSMLLDDLKRNSVRATFFLSPGAQNPSTDEQCAQVHRVLREGHSIQMHTYSHEDLLSLSLDAVYKDFSRWTDWVRECAGDQSDRLPHEFQLRPPFGNLNQSYATTFAEKGHPIVTWNVDSQDISGGNTNTVFSTIQNGLSRVPSDGSAIILMHEGSDGVVGLIDLLVPYLRGQGFSFVDTEECYALCIEQGMKVCRMDGVWPGTFDTPAVAPIL